MLNAFQTFESSKEGELFNTSRTNNWETLDIHHYILFFPKPNSNNLSGDCIPMNSRGATLAELSEVPVNLDPRFWRQRMTWSGELVKSLDHVGKNYLKYSLQKKQDSVESKLYRKCFRSLEFYRKSHRITDDNGESALYLAIAFEILLTDNYSRGVADDIYDRVSILLKGTKGNRKLKTAVGDLYEARSKYVHAGKVSDTLDLKTTRMAYIHTFLSISSKVKMKLPSRTDAPIKQLIGIN